jgi:hypothetical protein
MPWNQEGIAALIEMIIALFVAANLDDGEWAGSQRDQALGRIGRGSRGFPPRDFRRRGVGHDPHGAGSRDAPRCASRPPWGGAGRDRVRAAATTVRIRESKNLVTGRGSGRARAYAAGPRNVRKLSCSSSLRTAPKPGVEIEAAAKAAEIPERALIVAADVRTQRGQWWLPGKLNGAAPAVGSVVGSRPIGE